MTGREWRPLSLLLTGFLLCVSAAIAEGHAVPVALSPPPATILREAPAEVAIRYSERVEPRTSTLSVLDARGHRVAGETAAVTPGDPWLFRAPLPPLPDGVYTVSWRVLSADDGHVTEGAHVFVVGNVPAAALLPPAAVAARRSWLDVTGRWIHAGGMILIFGVLTAPLLLRGASPVRMPSGRILLVPAAIAAMGAGLALFAKSAEVSPDGSAWRGFAVVMSTTVGHVWAAKLVSSLLLVLVLAACGRSRRRRAWLWGAALVVALLTLVAGGLVGHGAAVQHARGLAVGILLAHLVAVGVWLGGLAFLATTFWRPEDRAHRLAAAAWTIPAFSMTATVAVAALAVTGLFLARLHLHAVEELWTTGYGRLLTAKLGLVTLMLALGGYHGIVAHRRVLAALAEPHRWAPTARRLRWTLRLEAALGLGVLFLAVALGATGLPGREAAARGEVFRQEREVDDARVVTEVSPLHPGLTTVRVTVGDRRGEPLDAATTVVLRLAPADAEVAPIVVTLNRSAPGAFSTTAPLLSLPGRWGGRIVVHRTGAYDLHDRLELEVRDPPSHGVHAAWPPPIHGPVGVAVAGILVGATLLVLRNRRTLQLARTLAHADPSASDGRFTRGMP